MIYGVFCSKSNAAMPKLRDYNHTFLGRYVDCYKMLNVIISPAMCQTHF